MVETNFDVGFRCALARVVKEMFGSLSVENTSSTKLVRSVLKIRHEMHKIVTMMV